MPKQTFFNLPGEKREKILDCAVEEFAARGYKQSSISRIVNSAGIAKGSFYQYFEDKDDLYAYVIKTSIADQKLAAYEREKDRLKDLSLTEYLRLVFHRQLDDFEKKPSLIKIGMDFMQLMGEPVYERIFKSYEVQYNTYYLPYIGHEVAQGEISPGVNQYLLNFMLVSMGQYIVYLIASGQAERLDRQMIDKLVDDLEYILKNGVYTGSGRQSAKQGTA